GRPDPTTESKFSRIPNKFVRLPYRRCGHVCCSPTCRLPMPRSSLSSTSRAVDISALNLQSNFQLGARDFCCAQCEYPLECVEKSRSAGSWLGCLIFTDSR